MKSEALTFYLWTTEVIARRAKQGTVKEVWMSRESEELFHRGLREHFPKVTNYKLPLDIVNVRMAYKDVKVRMVNERWDVAGDEMRRGKS